MTDTQRKALAAMDRENLGAVLVGSHLGMIHGGRLDSYAFRCDVREGTPTASGDAVAWAVLGRVGKSLGSY